MPLWLLRLVFEAGPKEARADMERGIPPGSINVAFWPVEAYPKITA